MRRILLLVGVLCLITFSFTSFRLDKGYNLGDDPDNCLDDLNVSNRFTPNGDGQNDTFSIYFPCKPESFEIQLYTRFGDEVFVSSDYNFVWEGNDQKGIPCEADVYEWKVNYRYHMKYVELSGQLLLIR